MALVYSTRLTLKMHSLYKLLKWWIYVEHLKTVCMKCILKGFFHKKCDFVDIKQQLHIWFLTFNFFFFFLLCENVSQCVCVCVCLCVCSHRFICFFHADAQRFTVPWMSSSCGLTTLQIVKVKIHWFAIHVITYRSRHASNLRWVKPKIAWPWRWSEASWQS